jgi:vitamin B12 transporter
MKRRTFAAVLLLMACGVVAAADEQDKPPQPIQYDVVVIATRIETPAREIASSVTVITSEELLRTRKTTVFEALQALIGLSTTQNGGPGAVASVFIRGANSEDTLVLIDGMEINDPIDPSRSCDLAHLSLSQVERVEILRGPQSPLYGSDAMGGVINIITRTGHGRPQLTLTGSTGTYRSWNGDLGLSGSSGPLNYALGLSSYSTRGISAADALMPGNTEPDGYRNLTASGKFGYAIGKNTTLELMIRRISDKTDLADFGGPYGDAPNNVQYYASTLARIQARSLFLSNRWEQKLSVSWIQSSRENINPVDEEHPFDTYWGTYGSGLVKLDWQNNIFLNPSNTLTAGLELSHEDGHSDYISLSQYGAYESAFPKEQAEAAGLYLQDQAKVSGQFFLAVGARLDTHSRTGTAATYKIAPAYIIKATGTKLKATLGTGFKSPSLYQLFAPATTAGPIGNLNLRPERAIGWDAGVEQDILGSRLRFGLTYFETLFRDLIDFDYTTGYINVDRARTRGVETFAEWRPREDLSLRTSYTRLSAIDEATGTPLLRRPKDKFSADVQARLFRRFDTVVSVLFVGNRTDTNFSVYPYQDVTLHSYALLNAVISTPVTSSLDLFLRLDNITNTRYEMVWGYGTLGFCVNLGFRFTR